MDQNSSQSRLEPQRESGGGEAAADFLSHRRRQLQAEATLALVSFFWGATFVVVKQAIESVPIYWFLTVRFGLATALVGLMAAVGGRAEGEPAFDWKPGLRAGAFLGLLYFLGYVFQTIGLKTTSATKSAFITETLVLWTPLMTIALLRRRPGLETSIAVPIGVVGLHLLIFNGERTPILRGRWVVGDFYTLLCSIAFAGHILGTKRLSHRFPTAPLVAVQLGVITMLSLAGSLIAGEKRGWDYPTSAWLTILFCAIFPTAIAAWAQTRMQRFTTEERTAIIFLFEPVFAALTGYVVLSERLGGFQWLGAGLILLAALLPEVWLLRRVKSEGQRESCDSF